jgi:putative membrane protein
VGGVIGDTKGGNMNVPYLLADMAGRSGEHWGPGPFGPLFLLLWLVLIGTVVWLVARSLRRREPSGTERARDILAERYARGDLSADEYRARLEDLR